MDKPVNFRDLGGLATSDGCTIQPYRLLRCGEVCGLSAQERDELTDTYMLAHIVDFRGESERGESPDDRIDGVEYTSIDIMQSMRKNAPSMSNFLKIENMEEVHGFMEKVYIAMIQDESSLEGYRLFLDILLRSEQRAVLFHCAAGKDRTGVGAAIVLSLLGVCKETVIKDYILTNELRAAANTTLLEKMAADGKSDAEIETMGTMMRVDQRYIETVYHIAEYECGSMTGYLQRHMGVTDKEIKRLKQLYLTDN